MDEFGVKNKTRLLTGTADEAAATKLLLNACQSSRTLLLNSLKAMLDIQRFLTADDVSELAKSLSLPLFARHDSLILDMKPSITNATPFFIRTRDYFAFFRESTDVYYVVNERLHETLTIINYKGFEKPDRGGFIVVVRGRVLTPYYDEFAV